MVPGFIKSSFWSEELDVPELRLGANAENQGNDVNNCRAHWAKNQPGDRCGSVAPCRFLIPFSSFDLPRQIGPPRLSRRRWTASGTICGGNRVWVQIVPSKADRPRRSPPKAGLLGVEELRFHEVGSEGLRDPLLFLSLQVLLLCVAGRCSVESRSSAVPMILTSVVHRSAGAVGPDTKRLRSTSITAATRRAGSSGRASPVSTVADRRGSARSVRSARRSNERSGCRRWPSRHTLEAGRSVSSS